MTVICKCCGNLMTIAIEVTEVNREKHDEQASVLTLTCAVKSKVTRKSANKTHSTDYSLDAQLGRYATVHT